MKYLSSKLLQISQKLLYMINEKRGISNHLVAEPTALLICHKSSVVSEVNLFIDLEFDLLYKLLSLVY